VDLQSTRQTTDAKEGCMQLTRCLIALCLAALTLPGFALPTLDAVQAEIGRGHYSQAEDMMREVIAAKPGSARAHYVYAEILAHDKHFDKATEEAAQARRIDPDLQFRQPEKFNAFVRLLEREQGTARRVASVSALGAPVQAQPMRIQAQPASGVPGWLWGLAAAVLALVAWRSLSARGQGQAAHPAKICIVCCLRGSKPTRSPASRWW
jgi:cytochrome c-type biogenesis protein CcmH/NrfG